MTYIGEGMGSGGKYRVFKLFWLDALEKSINASGRHEMKRTIIKSFVRNCDEGNAFGHDFYRDFPVAVDKDGKPVSFRVFFSVNPATFVVFLKYMERTE